MFWTESTPSGSYNMIKSLLCVSHVYSNKLTLSFFSVYKCCINSFLNYFLFINILK
jgi:hypothetical protein